MESYHSLFVSNPAEAMQKQLSRQFVLRKKEFFDLGQGANRRQRIASAHA
jgi:hypothetical protein